MAMIRHTFNPGEEPEVLTSISDECQGGQCETCPGIFHRDDYPGKSIFCVHESATKTEPRLGAFLLQSQLRHASSGLLQFLRDQQPDIVRRPRRRCRQPAQPC